MWQMVVRIECKDFSAVSQFRHQRDARESCFQQIQELITNTIGITPTQETLQAQVTRFARV